MSSSLYEQGYPIAPARDGVSAVRLARRVLPDVIVAKFDLPDMAGLELLTRLKADPVVSDIPVVMWGSDTDPRRRAMAMGAHTVYEGPPDIKYGETDSAFLDILNSALDRE